MLDVPNSADISFILLFNLVAAPNIPIKAVVKPAMITVIGDILNIAFTDAIIPLKELPVCA